MQTAPVGNAEQQTILEIQIEQINSRMKSLYETSNKIEAAINRLVNPRPVSAAAQGSVGTPSPQTIEGKLQQINRTLDGLVGDFSDHAERLNQSV